MLHYRICNDGYAFNIVRIYFGSDTCFFYQRCQLLSDQARQGFVAVLDTVLYTAYNIRAEDALCISIARGRQALACFNVEQVCYDRRCSDINRNTALKGCCCRSIRFFTTFRMTHCLLFVGMLALGITFEDFHFLLVR
jgi:hypothetical protein